MSEAERKITKKQRADHAKAMKELKWLQTNEATSAFADLQEAQEIEQKAESMLGSGETVEEIQSKKKREVLEKKKQLEARVAKFKAEKERKEREAAEKKKKLDEKLKQLQKEHGGINGTENTGYDDSAMSLYIGQGEQDMI